MSNQVLVCLKLSTNGFGFITEEIVLIDFFLRQRFVDYLKCDLELENNCKRNLKYMLMNQSFNINNFSLKTSSDRHDFINR